MFRSFALFILAFVACAAILEAKETIKIGVILPLSGQQSQNGEDLQDALLMKQKELKGQTTKFDYQLFFEDDAMTPRMAAEAAQKLINIDHVDMILSFSGSGIAVSPIAESKKIIHIGMSFSPAVARGFYCFDNFPKPAPIATLMIEFCKAAGYQNVAILGQHQAGTDATEDAFKAMTPAAKINIVTLQKFARPERDFRVALLKIREKNPDVVLVDAFDPEAMIILQQMHDIAFQIPITSMGNWGTFHDEAFYNRPYVEALPNRSFIQNFQRLYKRQSAYYSGIIYDSFGMLTHVCEECDGSRHPSNTVIAGKLRNIRNYPGVMGDLSPDSYGWFNIPAVLVIQIPEGRRQITLAEAVHLARVQNPASSH